MRSPLRLALKPHLKLNDHHHWFAGGCFFCTLVSILKFSSVQVASSAINTWHTWRRSLHSGAKTCLCHNTFPRTTLRKQTTGKKRDVVCFTTHYVGKFERKTRQMHVLCTKWWHPSAFEDFEGCPQPSPGYHLLAINLLWVYSMFSDLFQTDWRQQLTIQICAHFQF